MASSAENVKLGVCNVLFDGVDLGYTKGGVEVEVQTNTHEVLVDQFGETPISEIITGRTVQATVPLAETTLENLVAIMPGSRLVSDGVKAVGTVTFSSAAPVNGDKIVLAGEEFTWKTVPVLANDMPIAATIAAAAAALAEKISAAPIPFVAEASGPVTTITAKLNGVSGNVAIVKTAVTPAQIATVGVSGGVDATLAKVVVSSGININLIKLAKTLVLRPRGTTGEDDFTIYRSMCPGALNFAYQTDNERVFNSVFKGFVREDGELFELGDADAA